MAEEKDILSLDASGYIKGINDANRADASRSQTEKQLIAIQQQAARSWQNLAQQARNYTVAAIAASRQNMLLSRMAMNQPTIATSPNASNIMQGALAQAALPPKTLAEGYLAAASASAKLAAQNKATASATAGLVGQSEKLAYTWRIALRIFESFIIYRGLSVLANSFREATSAAIDFEIKISQIRTISQQSQLTIEEWATSLTNLSNISGLPLADVTAATYEAVSNQIGEGIKAIEFMMEVQKLAITTNSTMMDSQNALAGVINAYGLSVDDAASLSAKFFATIDLGRIKMADLGNYIGDVSAVASLLEVDLNEVLASLSEITIRSVTPSRALTQMRNIFQQMLKPSDDMKEAFKTIGVESATAGIKTFGLLNFLKKLADTSPGLEGLAELFRNIRGFAGAAILTSEEGFKQVIVTTEEIARATERYEKAVKISMESAGKDIQIQLNAIKNYFTTAFGLSTTSFMSQFSDTVAGIDSIVKGLSKSLLFILIPAILKSVAAMKLFKGGLSAGLTVTPFGAVLAGATAIASIITVYKILQEEAQKARDIQIRTLTETQNKIREKLKERYEIIKTNINRETQVYLQQSAEIVAKLNELQTVAVEFGGSVAANIKDSFQTTDDAVKNILDNVEEDLKKSTALVEKLSDSLQELKEESQRRDIAIAIEDKAPGQQIGILGAEVRRLSKSALSEKTFEGMENSFDQAKKYADQIKKITESTSKERAKIEKEIITEQKRYQSTDTKLRKEQDKSRGDARKGIQEQRILLKGEYSKTIDELQIKLSELGSLPITVEQANNAIRNISRLQEAEYRKRGSAAFKDNIENTVKLAKYQRLQDEITQIQRLENNTKFSDIIKLENEKELKSTFSEREKLMYQQLALLEELRRTDVDSANVTKNIEIVKTKLAYEQAAVKSNLAKREELSAQNVAKAKEEAFLLSVTAIKEEEIVAQKRLDSLERQKAIGEAQAASDLRLRKILFGTNYLDEETLRRQSFAKAGVVAPDKLDEVIAITKANIEKSRQSINDFLNSLPPSIRETIKAQVSQTEVVKTLTEKIGQASSAHTDYITSLRNLEEQTAATAAYLGALRANLPTIPIPTPVPNPPGSAAGGIAPRGMDSLLALLSPGEYVMNAKSTRKFYSQLVGMNAGIPGFASGGLVGNTFTGDFNISLQSSGNETVDVQRIGKLLRREIRRGTVVL